jgi:hypothetical protein
MIRHPTSLHPARSPALGQREDFSGREARVVHARRLRSTSATTTRCVGTPLRELWFLARDLWRFQSTLLRCPKAQSRYPCPKAEAERLGSCERHRVYASRRVAKYGDTCRPRITESRISPVLSERAPARRASNTFSSPIRAHGALEKPHRIRTGQDPPGVARPRRSRALKRTLGAFRRGDSPHA